MHSSVKKKKKQVFIIYDYICCAKAFFSYPVLTLFQQLFVKFQTTSLHYKKKNKYGT